MDISKFFKGVPDNSKYINSAACMKCGGLCCKHMSCHVAPGDFIKITKDIIKKAIDERLFCIDWWDGDPSGESDDEFYNGYYLRVRHKDSKAIDASIGGECIFLSDNGCTLPFALRPRGARDLIPDKDGIGEQCIDEYSKQQCAIDWMPYHDMLRELYLEYKEAKDYTKSPSTISEFFREDVIGALMKEEKEGHIESR